MSSQRKRVLEQEVFEIKKKILVIFLLIWLIASLVNANTFCSCEEFSFKFQLKNIEGFQESYRLGADFLSEYITFSENPVIMERDELKEISFTVKLPCDFEYGQYGLNVTISGEKSKNIYRLPLSFNLVSCYGYALERGHDFVIGVDKINFTPYIWNYSVCEGDIRAIPFLLKNTGLKNEFKFKLEAEEWAQLSGKSFGLLKDQQGVFYLSLAPPDGSAGNYTFFIVVRESLKNIETKNPVIIRVNKCYGVDVELDKKEDTICGCRQKSYDVIVANTGTNDAVFELMTAGPSWAILEINESLELEAGEEKSFKLNVEPPCKGVTSSQVEVIARLMNNSDVMDSDSIKLKFVPEEKCYKTKIQLDKAINVGFAATKIPLKIKNEGIIEQSYFIEVLEPEWASLDVDSVTVKQGQELSLDIIAEPFPGLEEGDYDLKVWLSSEGHDETKSSTLRLRKERELFNIYFFIGVGVIIFLILLIYFFMRAKKEEVKVRERRKGIIWIIVSLVIVGIAAYLLFLFDLWDVIWWSLYWYQYYIYTAIVLLAVLYIVFRSLGKRFKEIRDKRKKRRELKRLRAERARARAEKRGAKLIAKKPKKPFFFGFYLFLIFVVLLGIVAYFLINFNLGEVSKIVKNAGSNVLAQSKQVIENTEFKSILSVFYPYLRYIVAAVILILLLLIILFVYMKLRKRRKKVKFKFDIIKKILKNFAISVFSIIVIAAVFYVLVYYELIGYVYDFFVGYLNYILAGIVILIFIIIIIRFNKSFFGLFLGEDRKKKVRRKRKR